ncbi:MAG: c-type cytochrome [Acidimicrobiia bacterium]|nr:c-type cytochrome [Acidimicrobiia bacterium]
MLALSTTAIAWVLVLVIVVGWIVYAVLNIGSARREVGSEIELAANRRPYYDDEQLEGRRLELVQLLGVLLLVVVVIGLPLYWILEPSRQAGAVEGTDNRFENWGADLFATTADGGFNCAGCHGGMNATGGEAAYTVTDALTGEVRAVNWKAPALNTVLYRYDEDEVEYILNYGRPGSPMSAWGLVGGGPMNAQQIDSLIAYIDSIQIQQVDCLAGETDEENRRCDGGHLPDEVQADIDTLARQSVEDGTYGSYGEALFNLELNSGAYSCARCHTKGWSYGDPQETGQGAFGWNLTGGSVNTKFPEQEDMLEFLRLGSVNGQGYAPQAQGSGRMPGFGGMLTDEQLEAIAEYVRGL